MSVTIQKPFLPIYDARQRCFRAVVEIRDNDTTSRYHCELFGTEVLPYRRITRGLSAHAMRQHRTARTGRTARMEKTSPRRRIFF